MTEIASNLDAARDRLKAEMPAPYLTVPEVAALARCEHKAVRRAIKSGALPASRPAKQILIRPADAVRWIESHPAAATIAERPRPRSRRVAPGSVSTLRAMEQAGGER